MENGKNYATEVRCRVFAAAAAAAATTTTTTTTTAATTTTHVYKHLVGFASILK